MAYFPSIEGRENRRRYTLHRDHAMGILVRELTAGTEVWAYRVDGVATIETDEGVVLTLDACFYFPELEEKRGGALDDIIAEEDARVFAALDRAVEALNRA